MSVARGIEGRPWAAARAGAWLGSFGTTAASRRAIEAEQGRSVEEACCSGDGTGQRSTGRAREALMAGSGRSDGTASGGRPSAASAAVDRENRGGRERRK